MCVSEVGRPSKLFLFQELKQRGREARGPSRVSLKWEHFCNKTLASPLKTFPTAWSLALVWLHFLFGCDIGILVQKQEKVRTVGLSRICLLGGWHWDWAQPWRPAKNCDVKNQRSKYDAPQSWSFSIVTPSPPPKVIRIDKVNFCSP